MVEYEAALQENCENFLRHWGPIQWREHVDQMLQRNDQATALLLHGLAGIEDDAFYMQKKLRYGGAARLEPVRQFNAIWMVEEAEHGRALAALAAKYGWTGGGRRHDTMHRDKRAALALPVLKILSPFERGMLAAYMCLGVLVEYIAITSYHGISTMHDDADLRSILLQMSRQEGKHLRFYKRGAIAVLTGDVKSQKFVRFILSHYWRPPGIDLYGFEQWIRIFEPLLSCDKVRARYVDLDKLVDSLPGLDNLNLMNDFICRCNARIGTSKAATGVQVLAPDGYPGPEMETVR
jgi:hypothetical protein